MKNLHINAGFWIRLLARLIDFLIIAVLSNILLFLCIKKTNTLWAFRSTWLFYLWALFTACLVFFTFVIVPIITSSSSMGYKICRIKVITEKKSFARAIIEREALYGISWTLIILISTVLINHTLIFKLSHRVLNSKDATKLTNWEQTRISVTASIASLIFLIQAFAAITIILNKNNLGIHDRISGTSVIRINKYKIENKKQKVEFPTKRAINNKQITWVGEEIYE